MLARAIAAAAAAGARRGVAPPTLPLTVCRGGVGRTTGAVRAEGSSAAAQATAPAPALPTPPPPPAARRVFSGIQPTGIPHLGNYLGALQAWVALQEAVVPRPGAAAPPPVHTTANTPAAHTAPLVYCIVDLHAMTMPYDAGALQQACLTTAACLLAAGIDPARSVLFRQSAVREHSELAWLLSCVTPLGLLKRMTQFKQKSGRERDGACLGLLSYPVLQAADILLYRATEVPVGEDQHQHLELARDVAGAFNARARAPIFPLPATVSPPGAVRRVMSLRDASRKMSKSDPDDASRINLTDGPDAIRDKVRRAKTDSVTGFSLDAAGRPEKTNLVGIMAAVTGATPEAVAATYATASAAAFKDDLAAALIATLTPVGDEVRRRLADPAHLAAVLAAGGDAARRVAAGVMADVRAVAGIV